jgi:hypothetical protein
VSKFKIIILLFICLPGSSLVFSQPDTSKILPDTTDLNNSKYQEILLENTLEENEDSKLLDKVEYLKGNPVDLNTAKQEDLEEIPFMNSVVASRIINYRIKNGMYKSKRQLLEIDGITQDLYDKLKPYVIARNSKTDYVKDEEGNVRLESEVKGRNLFRGADLRIRSRIQQDLQTKEGYISGNYQGSKMKVYNRFTGNYKGQDYKLGTNLTLEKDAGEQKLTDFYSGYLELKDWKFVKKALAGDYVLNFGQGLGLWTSLSFSKGSETVDPVKKSGYSIESYRSTNEVQFFRGAATHINFDKYNLFVFYSDNYFDASVDTTLDEVSSIYFDGYHRTTTEQNRENSAKEKLIGGRLFADYNAVRLGVTYWTSKFSKPFIPDSSKQLYDFSGDKANMVSLDYDFLYRNLNLYGEFARSQSNSIAGLSALQISFPRIAELVFLYRNYPVDFAPVHSFGFGENNGNTFNENGFYAGLSFKPFKNLLVNTYFDQFKFPYRTYYNPVPTEGNDFLIYSEYKISKGFLLYARYKNKNKEETRTIQDEFGRDTKKIDNRNQMNMRLGFDYDLSPQIRIKSRYEYVMVDYSDFGGDNKGYLLYTDFRYLIMKNFSASTRFILFQTDDYDSRVYEFEDDLRGVMSNYGLYGKGTRWYIMMKYKPVLYAELTAKYSATYYDGVNSIGTGNDEIQGDLNNKFNLGLEILF